MVIMADDAIGRQSRKLNVEGAEEAGYLMSTSNLKVKPLQLSICILTYLIVGVVLSQSCCCKQNMPRYCAVPLCKVHERLGPPIPTGCRPPGTVVDAPSAEVFRRFSVLYQPICEPNKSNIIR